MRSDKSKESTAECRVKSRKNIANFLGRMPSCKGMLTEAVTLGYLLAATGCMCEVFDVSTLNRVNNVEIPQTSGGFGGPGGAIPIYFFVCVKIKSQIYILKFMFIAEVLTYHKSQFC